MNSLWLLKNLRISDKNKEPVDIAVAGGIIIAVGKSLQGEIFGERTVDFEGRRAIPGLVDGHVHFIGAAGDEGYSSKTPEIFVSHFLSRGITTAVGCLGFGRGVESLRHLYAKALTLEEEGLTTYVYTGSFQIPSPTITGSVPEDIILMEKVLGVKIAIADPCSSHPTELEIARLAGEAYVAGLQAGKPGLIHAHVGHYGDPYAFLRKTHEISGIPLKQFIPTHCNWNEDLLEGACDYVKEGGYADCSGILAWERGSSTSIRASKAVEKLLDRGAPLERLTISTDGNVGMPLRNAEGLQEGLYLERVSSLWEEIVELVHRGLSLDSAVALGTENPARRLGLYPFKGSLTPGAHADIVVLEEDYTICSVFARGKCTFSRGESFVFSDFEESSPTLQRKS